MSRAIRLVSGSMDATLKRTRDLLSDEFGMDVMRVVRTSKHVDLLVLRDVTAIVGVGGAINLLMAFSFEYSMLDELTRRMVPDEARARLKWDTYRREAALEIVNIVAGHCTEDWQSDADIIPLSPPVVIEQARSIHRPHAARFACIALETAHGHFDINFIGPADLFDDDLNYIEQTD
ncbi:chemotaxis protein CheX [Burkholderiaceae bacterium DAT-1]|nr:chemotaxis protein CheX [Burkholderiaceae bacterium DAT-1]